MNCLQRSYEAKVLILLQHQAMPGKIVSAARPRTDTKEVWGNDPSRPPIRRASSNEFIARENKTASEGPVPELTPFWHLEFPCLTRLPAAGCRFPHLARSCLRIAQQTEFDRLFASTDAGTRVPSKALRGRSVAILSFTHVVASVRTRPLWERSVSIVSATSSTTLTMYSSYSRCWRP